MKIENLKFKIIAFACCAGMFTISTSSVIAQTKNTTEILQVEPSILNITLSPGKTYHYDISVTNLLTQSLPLTLTVENFEEEDEEGGYQFTSTESLLSQWVRLSEKDMILSPNEKRTIPVDITIPKTVQIGGYSTIIFLNPILPQSTTNPTRVNAKIGVLAVANIGVPDSPKDKVEISNFSFDNFLHLESNPSFVLRVKNNSLYHRVVQPKIVLQNIFGYSEEVPFEERFIFPSKTRKWEKNLDLKNYNGLYSVTARVSVGDGIQIEKKTYIFIVTSGKIVVGIVLVLIVLLLFGVRKRLRKAFKELTQLSK